MARGGVKRLSAETLAGLPRSVSRPAYDRRAVAAGIVHLGVGNFHRAHQAVYADEALGAGDQRWGVTGVSLRSAATRDALAPQDGLYTLLERGPAGTTARVIGALREVLVAPESPPAVVARLADPRTAIVTLTLTEKGYGRAPGGAGLDREAPAIARDLAEPGRPSSAVGLLHAAARARRAAGAGGFTVLSCDNLSGNGRQTRALLLEFADAAGEGLGPWIERAFSFPDSMVDRIVPRTTDQERALVRERLGVEDAWPVATEPFRQWVIEDVFVAGRPRWEDFGVSFVADVAAWEQMKLRMLNAAHSCIAWLGRPAGWDTVDRAIAVPALRRFIEALWREEVAPTLPPAVRDQAASYAASLLVRFDNAALAHRTAQIAMDGSQKLPLRLLPTLHQRLAEGRPFDRLALGVAAWIRDVGGRDEAGGRYPLDDPLAGLLQDALAAAGDDPGRRVDAVLALPGLFPPEVAADARLRVALTRHLTRLTTSGSLGALHALERDLAANPGDSPRGAA